MPNPRVLDDDSRRVGPFTFKSELLDAFAETARAHDRTVAAELRVAMRAWVAFHGAKKPKKADA